MQIRKPFYLVFCISAMLAQLLSCTSAERHVEAPLFIAHGGGGIGRQTYTNSLEALDTNYEGGFRFFEIDFSWTADGELVAIHDWYEYGTFPDIFDIPGDLQGKVPSKAQFLRLKTKTGLTPLSLEDVLKWARRKQDVFIVTDVKEENIKALQKISSEFYEYKKYVVPQVYNYTEYDEAIALGYPDIILTLYRMRIDPAGIVRFAQRKAPFAVTMSMEVALSTRLAPLLQQGKTRVYVHTVNDISLFSKLRQMGVFGIYTDFMAPP